MGGKLFGFRDYMYSYKRIHAEVTDGSCMVDSNIGERPEVSGVLKWKFFTKKFATCRTSVKSKFLYCERRIGYRNTPFLFVYQVFTTILLELNS